MYSNVVYCITNACNVLMSFVRLQLFSDNLSEYNIDMSNANFPIHYGFYSVFGWWHSLLSERSIYCICYLTYMAVASLHIPFTSTFRCEGGVYICLII